MPLFVTPTLTIPDWELGESFVRASGPGGQNVNKVATAVQLRFDAQNSPSLTPPVKARLLRLAGRAATREGVIIIHAHRFRTQSQNRDDARERLKALLLKALNPPKKRAKTTVPFGEKRKRLQAKQRRAAVKEMRGRIRDFD